MKITLANVTQNPIEIIFKAYKVCYSKVGQTDITIPKNEDGTVDYGKMVKFIQKYMLMNHLSPLEHINFTFYIEGVSRALTHQLVRHRIASYNQQSQRYVEGNAFEFIIPPAIEKDNYTKKIFTETMMDDMVKYNKLVDNLIATQIKDEFKDFYEKHYVNGDSIQKIIEDFKREYKGKYVEFSKKSFEDARYILPNATSTNITVTMNARTLRHFLAERLCVQAQWEIRELAQEMMNLAVKEIPFIAKGVMKCESCTDDKCPKNKCNCSH